MVQTVKVTMQTRTSLCSIIITENKHTRLQANRRWLHSQIIQPYYLALFTHCVQEHSTRDRQSSTLCTIHHPYCSRTFHKCAQSCVHAFRKKEGWSCPRSQASSHAALSSRRGQPSVVCSQASDGHPLGLAMLLFTCCVPGLKQQQVYAQDKTSVHNTEYCGGGSLAGCMIKPVIHLSGNIPDLLHSACTTCNPDVRVEQGLCLSATSSSCKLRIILIGPAVLDPAEPDAKENARMRQLLDIEAARCWSTQAFIIMWHPDATEDAALRYQAFTSGANMVTFSKDHVQQALSQVLSQALTGKIVCEWCGMKNLTQTDYYLHQPLYHVHEEKSRGTCQICQHHVYDLAQHVHEDHAPYDYPHRTGVIALTVVRRRSDGKFLAVQEREGMGYFLPGGGVDPGESLTAGAEREVLEEAGVRVKLLGVLDVLCRHEGMWRRVIFYAEPVSDTERPKTVPDRESAGACWVDVEELNSLRLRSASEFKWLQYVHKGGKVLPLQIPPEHAHMFGDLEL